MPIASSNPNHLDSTCPWKAEVDRIREECAKIVEAAPRCRKQVCGRNEIAEAVRAGGWKAEDYNWAEGTSEDDYEPWPSQHFPEECAYSCPKHRY